MPTDKIQGEGDYEAARNHNDAQREFVESGQVQKAARDAEPKNQAEADEMARAEAEGKSHSKGEVPGEVSNERAGRSEEAAGPTGIAQPPKGN